MPVTEDGIRTYRIGDPRDLLTATDDIARYFDNHEVWWRGQTKPSYELQPGIFRLTDDSDTEASILNRFLAKAPAREPDCPAMEDRASWLFLAQHHRLLTRLLDWTSSMLIGAGFASNKDFDCDGVLWALSPFDLNNRVWDRDAVFSYPYGPKEMQILVDQAFETSLPESAWCHHIACVYPVETHKRMMHQRSAFTIHGTPVALDRHENYKSYLCRVIIPASLKQHMVNMLHQLGLRNEDIFPDLDHLAASINNNSFHNPPIIDT